LPKFLGKEEFAESIHKAQFKKDPSDFHKLSKDEIEQANANPVSSVLPRQEKGTRESRSLPYELYVDGNLSGDKGSFQLRMEASSKLFGTRAAGAPFQVYGPGKQFALRNYAVKAGDAVIDSWSSNEFDGGNYHFKAYGPNGFFREFKGTSNDALIEITFRQEIKSKTQAGNLLVVITNKSQAPINIVVKDNSYGQKPQSLRVGAGAAARASIDIRLTKGWYDASVLCQEFPGYENRAAGRVETGNDSITDPLMA
jgi:phospholipase C